MLHVVVKLLLIVSVILGCLIEFNMGLEDRHTTWNSIFPEMRNLLHKYWHGLHCLFVVKLHLFNIKLEELKVSISIKIFALQSELLVSEVLLVKLGHSKTAC